jgi:dipeptidyl aminopeptidase/acylaminoacyl peptidase
MNKGKSFWIIMAIVVACILIGVVGIFFLSTPSPSPAPSSLHTPSPSPASRPNSAVASRPANLAFWQHNERNNLVLSTLQQDGSLDTLALNTPSGAVFPRLAPNGVVVAFIGGSGSPQVQAIGTSSYDVPVPLTDTPHEKRDLAWLPDGRWLAYTENITTANGTDCGVLTLIAFQERRTIPLTTPAEDGCVGHLAPAPHHNYLLFNTIPQQQDAISSTIHLAIIDTQEQRAKIGKWVSPTSLAQPVWSPDELLIAATTPDGGLYRINVQSSGDEQRLIAGTSVVSPTWYTDSDGMQYLLYLAGGGIWRIAASENASGCPPLAPQPPQIVSV